MKRIRYLTLMLMLIGVGSSWAQDDDPFNPTSPAEPGPSDVPMLTLLAEPVDGGTVSGAGWYSEGTKVTLRASSKENYVFERWADANGTTVSTEPQFQYTKKSGDETLTAYFRFSPGSPAEPTEIPQYYQLTVVADDGGTVSGGGKYLPGSSVWLSASPSTGFVFYGWYDEEEVLVSSSASFNYITLAKPVILTARFRFNPSAPGEPSEPIGKHTLTVMAEEGGTVSTGGSRMQEGATVTLNAIANTGYVFTGWYAADTLYAAASSFLFTMGKEDVCLTARFAFNPSSPGEPQKPTTHKYAFYLMNVVTNPGKTARVPVYLTSLDELIDVSFQLTFPVELVPDLTNVEVTQRAYGYNVESSFLNDTTCLFSLTGGRLPDGNAALIVLNVNIPDDIATARNYPVKINQVVVTDADGAETTASTRNGRISVYKPGDANGDDTVNMTDVREIVDVISGVKADDFSKARADVNHDSNNDIGDIIAVIRIMAGVK